jgi:EAL domain-containing protein (putative c-di-GMP-specific phosphodiesterase class I)
MGGIVWQLEGVGAEGSPWVVAVTATPFRVGRRGDCQLCLSEESISRHHAELYLQSDVLHIADLGSTNGTFVNGQRLQAGYSWPLQAGDELHFAGVKFRIGQTGGTQGHTVCRDFHVDTFRVMLETKAVTPVYQPLVRFSDGRVMGYELLGRIRFPGLPEMPGPIFRIARRLGKETELSALFRDMGVEQAARSGYRGPMFFNTLPVELQSPELPAALIRLRRQAPEIRLGLEVHENTVTDVPTIRTLKHFLNEQGIDLVYDDFGSGQARLVEIIKAPPDCLKFDIALIHDIHKSAGLQTMVSALVRTCRDAGIVTLAEGIEKAEEAEVCRQMGFDLAQGFYFGEPSPILPEAGETCRL